MKHSATAFPGGSHGGGSYPLVRNLGQKYFWLRSESGSRLTYIPLHSNLDQTCAVSVLLIIHSVDLLTHSPLQLLRNFADQKICSLPHVSLMITYRTSIMISFSTSSFCRMRSNQCLVVFLPLVYLRIKTYSSLHNIKFPLDVVYGSPSSGSSYIPGYEYLISAHST